jgi:hypothetical protein
MMGDTPNAEVVKALDESQSKQAKVMIATAGIVIPGARICYLAGAAVAAGSVTAGMVAEVAFVDAFALISGVSSATGGEFKGGTLPSAMLNEAGNENMADAIDFTVTIFGGGSKKISDKESAQTLINLINLLLQKAPNISKQEKSAGQDSSSKSQQSDNNENDDKDE